MRSFILFLASLLVVAAGCGGRTNAFLGSDDGGGSSSGGSSGSSSGYGSSSGSSSGYGSSSGSSSGYGSSSGSSSGYGSSSGSSSGYGSSSGSSSGYGSSSGSSSGYGGSSGSSSGSSTCEPLPGCDSSFGCPAPDGCGFCLCDFGDWICNGDRDAGATCPGEPPAYDTPCSSCNDGVSCGYTAPEGCGENCTCEGGRWQCEVPPCSQPVRVCPEFPPSTGTGCFAVGSSCFYGGEGSCGDATQCVCDPSGTFDCFSPCDGLDGGFDATPPMGDGGFYDAGSASCPEQQPADSMPCASEGLACSYFAGCQTNCLCAGNAWVCASEPPCAMGN